MRRAIVLLTPCIVTAFCLAADQPNQKPADQPRANELVRRLSDRKFAVREAAAKAIEELGPAALPALRKAKDHPDPQVRAQVAKWIPKFETRALVDPRLVTLHLKDRPAREALLGAAKQAGYKLSIANDAADRASQSHDFDFAKVPFWVALDAICSQNGLVTTLSSNDESPPSLLCQEGHYPYVYHHGAFRVIADQIDRSVQKYVRLNRVGGRAFAGPNSYESFQVQLTIEPEPRLHIVEASVEEIAEASDDHKHSMVAPAWTNPRIMGFGGRRHMFGGFGRTGMSSGVSLSVSLNSPSSDASTLQVLKGTAAVTIGKEHKSLLITDKVLSAKGVKCRGSKATLEITDVRKTPDGCEIAYTVSGDLTRLPDLELTDAQGNRFDSRGNSMSSNGRKWEARLHFGPGMGAMMGRGAAPGAPARLTWSWWESVECHVPFEFRDLPIP